jgi:hypothetical protein
MGTRASYEPGTFSWVDLATSDPAGARAFYGELLGWDAEDSPVPGGGVYTTCSIGGASVAALYELREDQRGAGMAPHWLSYVTVAGADEVTARAEELGGAIHMEPFDVMEAGRMAVLADPPGAAFAIWEPREAIGAERVNEPGCLTWNDLATTDPERAQRFYGELFGWGFEAVDSGGGPRYWVIGHDGGSAGRNGGMRELGPDEAGIPPHWMPYFAVESADATAEQAQSAGGTLVAGPIDLPAGRVAAFTDPQGAAFAVFAGELDD